MSHDHREARQLAKRHDTLVRRVRALRTEAEDVFVRLLAMRSDTERRFEISHYPCPNGTALKARRDRWWQDPLVIDLLARCDLPGHGHWVWTGPTKDAGGKSTPVFRQGNTDRTVLRHLALASGLIPADERRFVWRGATCPVGCVNPWHAYVGGERIGS